MFLEMCVVFVLQLRFVDKSEQSEDSHFGAVTLCRLNFMVGFVGLAV